MIHDVDESIRAYLKRDALNGSNVEISFEAPNSDWGARRQGPALNAYLYDIREDLRRRDVNWREERRDGLVADRFLPPRYFKLAYLITAWTQRPEDEHRLLSAALGCFLRSDALPQDVLQGALTTVGEALRVTIALPSSQDGSISDVWTALGGELKPSLDLVITVPFTVGRSRHFGPPVREVPRLSVLGPDGQRHVSMVRGGARRAGGIVSGAMSAGHGAGEDTTISETVYGGRSEDEGADGKGGRKGLGGTVDEGAPGYSNAGGARIDRPGRAFWIRSIAPLPTGASALSQRPREGVDEAAGAESPGEGLGNSSAKASGKAGGKPTGKRGGGSKDDASERGDA